MQEKENLGQDVVGVRCGLQDWREEKVSEKRRSVSGDMKIFASGQPVPQGQGEKKCYL